MPTRRGRSMLLLALAAACVLALLVQRCTHTQEQSAPSPAQSSGAEQSATATAGAAAKRSAGERADAPTSGTAGATRALPAAVDAGSTFGRVMQLTDAHDRELLADIERRTKLSPPASVHELIALRRNGADRAELERFIDQHLGDKLLIRIAAQRWLRAVAPRPGIAPETSPAAPAKLGEGGGKTRIAPIENVGPHR